MFKNNFINGDGFLMLLHIWKASTDKNYCDLLGSHQDNSVGA